jgi:tetrahydromethanopterin S-methyltransferase subunit B
VKAVDTSNALATDTTGAMALLNGIVPGVGFAQRVGRQVRCHGMLLRVKCAVTAGTGVDQTVRVLVVQDHQTNGAAPAITDVLTAVGTVTFRNLINQARFKILCDKVFDLNATAEAGSIRSFQLRLPVKALTQFNDGNAGTVADIVTNSFYVMVMGSIVAGVLASTTTVQCRYLFSDE